MARWSKSVSEPIQLYICLLYMFTSCRYLTIFADDSDNHVCFSFYIWLIFRYSKWWSEHPDDLGIKVENHHQHACVHPIGLFMTHFHSFSIHTQFGGELHCMDLQSSEVCQVVQAVGWDTPEWSQSRNHKKTSGVLNSLSFARFKRVSFLGRWWCGSAAAQGTKIDWWHDQPAVFNAAAKWRSFTLPGALTRCLTFCGIYTVYICIYWIWYKRLWAKKIERLNPHLPKRTLLPQGPAQWKDWRLGHLALGSIDCWRVPCGIPGGQTLGCPEPKKVLENLGLSWLTNSNWDIPISLMLAQTCTKQIKQRAVSR